MTAQLWRDTCRSARASKELRFPRTCTLGDSLSLKSKWLSGNFRRYFGYGQFLMLGIQSTCLFVSTSVYSQSCILNVNKYLRSHYLAIVSFIYLKLTANMGTTTSWLLYSTKDDPYFSLTILHLYFVTREASTSRREYSTSHLSILTW